MSKLLLLSYFSVLMFSNETGLHMIAVVTRGEMHYASYHDKLHCEPIVIVH